MEFYDHFETDKDVFFIFNLQKEQGRQTHTKKDLDNVLNSIKVCVLLQAKRTLLKVEPAYIWYRKDYMAYY